jgi:hypothetical protein
MIKKLNRRKRKENLMEEGSREIWMGELGAGWLDFVF